MSKENCSRVGCKDVFNAFLVEDANYTDGFEFPIIEANNYVPEGLIAFSRCKSSQDYKSWVHFYEDDVLFERIWRNPSKYLEILSKYEGIILPDFSLYRDMPYVMQLWNIYRSRAIGSWLQSNNRKVIPNIRFADERTYDVACQGIARNGSIAVGSHGTIKNREDRKYFAEGLDYVVNKLNPQTIIVYGKTPDDIFERYKKRGIQIVQFESDYSTSHKEVE